MKGFIQTTLIIVFMIGLFTFSSWLMLAVMAEVKLNRLAPGIHLLADFK